MKSPYDWFMEFARTAGRESRTVENQICDKVFQSGRARDNPRLQLSLLNQARDMADRLGNRRLVLAIAHWRAQCMMHFLHDRSELLETVVTAVVEARQPQFQNLPQRFCLHEDLIGAYMSKDPLGHVEAIQQALSFLDREVPPDLSCRFCYLHLRTSCKFLMEDAAAAWESELATLAEIRSRSESRSVQSHHLMVTYNKLCHIAAHRQDWEAVVENAIAGLPYAGEMEMPERISVFRLWHAVGLKALGQDSDAQRLFRMARRRKLKRAMSSYYEAVSLYHVLANRPHLAWKAREQEFAEMAGQGRFWDECECRLERCKLARQMNKPDLLQTEADALREVAANLKHPQVITDKLDQVVDQL